MCHYAPAGVCRTTLLASLRTSALRRAWRLRKASHSEMVTIKTTTALRKCYRRYQRVFVYFVLAFYQGRENSALDFMASFKGPLAASDRAHLGFRHVPRCIRTGLAFPTGTLPSISHRSHRVTERQRQQYVVGDRALFGTLKNL